MARPSKPTVRRPSVAQRAARAIGAAGNQAVIAFYRKHPDLARGPLKELAEDIARDKRKAHQARAREAENDGESEALSGGVSFSAKTMTLVEADIDARRLARKHRRDIGADDAHLLDPTALPSAALPEGRARPGDPRRSKASRGKAALERTLLGRQMLLGDVHETLRDDILREHPHLAPGASGPLEPAERLAELVRLAGEQIKVEAVPAFVTAAVGDLPAAMRVYHRAIVERVYSQCLPFYRALKKRFPSAATLQGRAPWVKPPAPQQEEIPPGPVLPLSVAERCACAIAARLPLSLVDLAFEVGVGIHAWPDLPPERGPGAGPSRQRTLAVEVRLGGYLVRSWRGSAPLPPRAIDLLDPAILAALYRPRGGAADAARLAEKALSRCVP